MPVFKILRMKDAAQQHFRWQPHTTGATEVKLKDYQEAGEIEAEGAYEAWQRLRDTGNPLRVGDLLQTETGVLRICKFVGFEEAHWWVPEPKPAVPPGPEPESDGADAAAAGEPAGPGSPQSSEPGRIKV